MVQRPSGQLDGRKSNLEQLIMCPAPLGFLIIPSLCKLLLVFLCLLTFHGRLLGDCIAGVTVASILIPQSISYASSLAKLPPLTGLVSVGLSRSRTRLTDIIIHSSQLQFLASYMLSWDHPSNLMWDRKHPYLSLSAKPSPP
jgi:hypothetical protein